MPINDKRKKSELAQVREINSVKRAREYLGLSQRQLGTLIGAHQTIVCKVERNRARYDSAQVERLAIEVARLFRVRTGRDDLGLRYSYNSPLRFKVAGWCRYCKKEFAVRDIRSHCKGCAK